MKATLTLLAMLFGYSLAQAAADEAVVQHVLRDSHGITADEIRRDYDACDSTTLSMRICSAYRVAVQDIRLNRLYSQASAQARELGFDASLRDAEKAWLNYRDAQCAFEGQNGGGGGTAQPLYVLSCKEELTKIQADRLEAGLVRR